MILAHGSVVPCSRTENVDLFRHAMGGYGLFGVITELERDMVPNALLTPRFEERNERIERIRTALAEARSRGLSDSGPDAGAA
jgi:FAD/FMN-containing dehydrogenase